MKKYNRGGSETGMLFSVAIGFICMYGVFHAFTDHDTKSGWVSLLIPPYGFYMGIESVFWHKENYTYGDIKYNNNLMFDSGITNSPDFIPVKKSSQLIQIIEAAKSNIASQANIYDGKSFGADGLPLNCNDFSYQSPEFGGYGIQICQFAKKMNFTVGAWLSTGVVAVTLEIANRCGFTFTEIGLKGIQKSRLWFPKTWKVYMSHPISKSIGLNCKQAHLIYPLIFK